MDHLLDRLTVAPPAIASRIINLLSSSYFPENKDDSVKVGRCVALCREHHAAARMFYAGLGAVAADSAMARFSVVLGNCVKKVYKSKIVKDGGVKGAVVNTAAPVKIKLDPMLDDFDDEDEKKPEVVQVLTATKRKTSSQAKDPMLDDFDDDEEEDEEDVAGALSDVTRKDVVCYLIFSIMRYTAGTRLHLLNLLPLDSRSYWKSLQFYAAICGPFERMLLTTGIMCGLC